MRRAVARAATGDVARPRTNASLFSDAVARVPATRYLFNNTCQDILAIAAEMLDGEVDYRKGNHDQAFAHLRRSVELDDNLPYDEPWGWMQPTRHALGALLLEQGQVEEAEAVYRADLGLDGTLARACQHPDNVWSLHGFHECLTRLGKDDARRRCSASSSTSPRRGRTYRSDRPASAASSTRPSTRFEPSALHSAAGSDPGDRLLCKTVERADAKLEVLRFRVLELRV